MLVYRIVKRKRGNDLTGEGSRIKGDRWLGSISSLAIRVPSKVVPQDFNIVLNPLYPDYHKIRLIKVEDFDFDFRLSSIHS